MSTHGHAAPTILVVDPDPQTLVSLATPVSEAGYDVVTASSFEEAASRAITAQAIITAVRLGAYNGLHLVVRARAIWPRMVAIVIDTIHDPVLSADAAALNAIYLVKPVDPAALLEILRRQMPFERGRAGTDTRRWPRAAALDAAMHVARWGDSEAVVVDVSYGGVRLESADPLASLGPDILELPDKGLSLRGRPVWIMRLESGRSWAGIEIEEGDRHAVTAWRRFVDENGKKV